MLQRPDYSKKYYLRIVLLILIGAVAELIIWWTMVREETVDWIGKQVIDQAYPYAITEIDDGRIVVGNVVDGFEVTLPKGFMVIPIENPAFLYKENDLAICRVESNVTKYRTSSHVEKLIENQSTDWIKTYAGISSAHKKENNEEGRYSYLLQIPINNIIIEYNLTAGQGHKDKCRSNFEKIKTSFIYYE